MTNGLCQCGCGEITNIRVQNKPKLGYKKGDHYRFVFNHYCRVRKGALNSNWKGGRSISKRGYITIYKTGKRVKEHRFIAERILGKTLPPKVIIHHADENPSNNNSNNLVICENVSYHRLLHKRKQSYDECGHADWLKCQYCKKHDPPNKIHISPSNIAIHYHKKCAKEHRRSKRWQNSQQT